MRLRRRKIKKKRNNDIIVKKWKEGGRRRGRGSTDAFGLLLGLALVGALLADFLLSKRQENKLEISNEEKKTR